MTLESQPVVVEGQPPIEAAPETAPVIDRAAIEAEIEASRIRPLEERLAGYDQVVGRKETERRKALDEAVQLRRELAEQKALNTSFKARVKEDGADDDWVELQERRAQEAARTVAPDAAVQQEWVATQILAQKHGIVITNPDGSGNPDLPWADITADGVSQLEGLQRLQAAIIDTATTKRAAARLAEADAKAAARIDALQAEHDEKMRELQRVNTGGQGGGGGGFATVAALEAAFLRDEFGPKHSAAAIARYKQERAVLH